MEEEDNNLELRNMAKPPRRSTFSRYSEPQYDYEDDPDNLSTTNMEDEEDTQNQYNNRTIERFSDSKQEESNEPEEDANIPLRRSASRTNEGGRLPRLAARNSTSSRRTDRPERTISNRGRERMRESTRKAGMSKTVTDELPPSPSSKEPEDSSRNLPLSLKLPLPAPSQSAQFERRNLSKEDDFEATSFNVVINGQVESCEFVGCDNLFCKYYFVAGEDWRVISGPESGLSQSSMKAKNTHVMVWNFPLEISYRSTNASGWPQIALSVWGPDWLGNEVIRGYGATHVPIAPGRYERYVRLFTPIGSNWLAHILGKVSGYPTEYKDTRFVAKAEGRQITKVQSHGIVKIQFNVMTRGMAKFGYTEEAQIGHTTPIAY